jgi:hypothetical protein
LHIYGPTTAQSFAGWAGVGPRSAATSFDAVAGELLAVRTPIGDAWILSADERSFLRAPDDPAPARLLPSGDAYWLLQGADRELLVPDEINRPLLWTPRVWPGALLVDGEIMGTWRRATADVSIAPWRALTTAERDAVEAEAAALPLPDLAGKLRVRWET